MTAMTYTHHEPGPAKPWLVLCLLAGIVAALTTVALWPRTTPTVVLLVRVPPKIGVELSDAIAHHGEAMVATVRGCFDKGGADMVYRERLGKDIRFHLLCQLSNGTWVDRIIMLIDGKWEEITAFVPGDGTLNSIWRWFGPKIISKITSFPW